MISEPIIPSPEWATTVIIASGPSRSEEQLELIRVARERNACRVIAINREWEWAPWADLLYAADISFWRMYGARIVREFDGCRWSCVEKVVEQFPVCYVKGENRPGLSLDATTIHLGSNSGYAAIGLAYHLGARRIVLCGYDMAHTGGRAHHFGNHAKGLNQAADPSKWAPLFRPLDADLVRVGVDVINCTSATALDAFRRAGLRETLESC